MAAPAVIVSVLVSSGVGAAVKKYGKKAVERVLDTINKQFRPSKVKTANDKVGKGMGKEPGPIRVDKDGVEFAVFGREVIQAYKNQARNLGFAIGTLTGIGVSGKSSQGSGNNNQSELDKLREENKKLNQQAAARMEKDKQSKARQVTAQLRQNREDMGGR
jgi:hypothetical protein